MGSQQLNGFSAALATLPAMHAAYSSSAANPYLFAAAAQADANHYTNTSQGIKYSISFSYYKAIKLYFNIIYNRLKFIVGLILNKIIQIWIRIRHQLFITSFIKLMFYLKYFILKAKVHY